jgi:peptide/nickel transport system ATP-binding protein
MKSLLQVENLVTRFDSHETSTLAVDGVTFDIKPGETLCLVGESGSGKSVTGLSILGLLPETAVHPSGRIVLTTETDTASETINMLAAPENQMQSIRGARISMIFQEPMTCLNPVLTIGEQLMEPLDLHLGLTGVAARERAIELLTQVEMPDPERRLDEYPHRLSGGQRQKEHQTALLFITHDLSVVSEIADRVIVMRQGQIVERGDRHQVLSDPKHAYTKELLAALPGNLERLSKSPPHGGRPLLAIRDLCVYFPVRKGLLKRHVGDVKAVDQVSLDVARGRTLALVGESGSGKTTLGRALLGLIRPTSGSIEFEDTDLATLDRAAFKPYRKDLQIVFQDPQSSLNPRLSIGSILTEPMAAHGIGESREERFSMAGSYLTKVGLSPDMLNRYPHEFSGGQRQRIGIARAIALEPRFIVCDEVTSALDVSVQAKILLLLDELKRDLDLTYLFITHNIDVVRYFADDIAVMYQGRIVETGGAQAVCDNPTHEYTQRLLAAVPKFVA